VRREPLVGELHQKVGQGPSLGLDAFDARIGDDLHARFDADGRKDRRYADQESLDPSAGSKSADIRNCSRWPNQPQIGCRRLACKASRT
jgi:hypothetical protein